MPHTHPHRVGFRIPPGHEPDTGDQLARWRLLQTSGHRPHHLTGAWTPPTDPALGALADALTSAGLDPAATSHLDHAATLDLLHQGAAAWTRTSAASAFTAALWSAPAAWRSALPGVLLAEAMPAHPFAPWSAASPTVCEVCGYRDEPVHLLTSWALRLTGGTPLDGDPTGYAATLDWCGTERPQPTDYDRWALAAVFAVIRSLPVATRYSAAAKAITGARILRGRWAARDVLEALALVGVLAPPDRPGLSERFTTYRERDQRPTVRVEVQAPLAWWNTDVGDGGIRTDIAEELFGDLGLPTVDLEGPRPTPTPPEKQTLDGGLAARVRALTPRQPRASASVGSGPVAPGDVWAIRLEPGRWVTAYVHEVRERERPYAHAEYLLGVHEAQPGVADVTLRVAPRLDGRAPQWVHSLETTPWVRRIAQGVPPPDADEPRPSDGSWQSGRHFKELSGWYFR